MASLVDAIVCYMVFQAIKMLINLILKKTNKAKKKKISDISKHLVFNDEIRGISRINRSNVKKHPPNIIR